MWREFAKHTYFVQYFQKIITLFQKQGSLHFPRYQLVRFVARNMKNPIPNQKKKKQKSYCFNFVTQFCHHLPVDWWWLAWPRSNFSVRRCSTLKFHTPNQRAQVPIRFDWGGEGGSAHMCQQCPWSNFSAFYVIRRKRVCFFFWVKMKTKKKRDRDQFVMGVTGFSICLGWFYAQFYKEVEE